MKGLFGELSDQLQISTLFCDSQSAIFLTKDQMFYGRTKHIYVRYHFVREIIARGDIVMSKVGTLDNLADMKTKSRPIANFVLCSNLVGLGCQVFPYRALLWKRSMVLILFGDIESVGIFLLMLGICVKVEIVDL